MGVPDQINSQPGLQNAVLWPSLLWGLVPFALNSMTQPAGLICGADADVGFLLRSSPVICLVDSILILARFAFYYYHTRSIRKAHSMLISSRYQSYLYQEFKEKKRSGDQTALRNEQYTRVIVFLLTVSQFVKIFAFQELVWTKIIASFYLGSFLVTEAVIVWPVAWMKDIEEVEEENSMIITYSSIALAVAFMLWFTSVACTDISGQSHHTLPQWAARVIGCLGAILAIPALGYSFRHCGTWRQVRVTTGLLLFVLGAPIGFYFTGQAIPATFPLIWIRAVTAAMAAVWGGIGFLYASEATRAIRAPTKVEQRKKVEQTAACYFFLLHCVTAVLFYIFSYSPVGTVKPAWTEYLG